MSKPDHNQRRSQNKPWRKRLFAWAWLAALVFCVGLVIGHYKTAEKPRAEQPAAGPSMLATRELVLYFASLDGQALVPETRSISECSSDEDCLRETVQALINGPQDDLAAIFPEQVELHGVAVADSLVSLDFGHELIAAHPGGTQSELLTIYGLADSLAVNFPHLRQVRILVDGAPVETLKGHVDLRQPVLPDFSLVQEGLSPAGKMTSLPAGRDE